MQDRIPIIDREGPVKHWKQEPVVIRNPTAHSLNVLRARRRITLSDLALEIQHTTPPIQTFFGGMADRLKREKPRPEAVTTASEVADYLVDLGVATRLNHPDNHLLDTVIYSLGFHNGKQLPGLPTDAGLQQALPVGGGEVPLAGESEA